MSERSGLTVSGVLWVIAFVSMLLGALVSRPTTANVVSLAAVGHGLTALALRLEVAGERVADGRTYTLGIFGGTALGEGIGLLVAWWLGSDEFVVWFGLGASFSIVGMVATWRRTPSDSVLSFQIFYHALVLLPLLVALPAFGFDFWKQPEGAESQSLGHATMSLTTMIFCVVGVPLLFVTLLAGLAYQFQRPDGERDQGWSALIVHQAVLLLLVARWGASGF